MTHHGGGVYLSLNPAGFDLADFQNPTEIVEAINLFDQPLSLVDEVLPQLARAAVRPGGAAVHRADRRR
ncbi:MAG: hypothetical protein KatS3mg009_2167 [Acidimicrobiia bacterium]|nr:MAG: hypothetical protein KatS3mg009_2167 [Acidimicrobiia bacterium]